MLSEMQKAYGNWEEDLHDPIDRSMAKAARGRGSSQARLGQRGINRTKNRGGNRGARSSEDMRSSQYDSFQETLRHQQNNSQRGRGGSRKWFGGPGPDDKTRGARGPQTFNINGRDNYCHGGYSRENYCHGEGQEYENYKVGSSFVQQDYNRDRPTNTHSSFGRRGSQADYNHGKQPNFQRGGNKQDYFRGKNYNSSQMDSSVHDQEGRKEGKLIANVLVDILINYENCVATYLQLFEKHNLTPMDVRQLTTEYGDTFFVEKELVHLRPKMLTICSRYTTKNGCRSDTCSELHICEGYVVGDCSARMAECIWGHKWYSDHNKPIIKAALLGISVPPACLCTLLKSLSLKNPANDGELDICLKYNQNRCINDECTALHICLSYVVNRLKCSNRDCKLLHNLKDPTFSVQLRRYGVSTNNAPMDILKAIFLKNSQLDKQTSEDNLGATGYKSGNSKKKNKNSSKNRSSSHASSDESEVTTSSDSDASESGASEYTLNSDSDHENQKKSKKKKNSKGRKCKKKKSSKSKGEKFDHNSSSENVSQKTPEKNMENKIKSTNDAGTTKNETPTVVTTQVNVEPRKTVWSHEYKGDTEIAEICFYSVESSCRYEESGCRRLHAALHFHWQVSEQQVTWLNLPFEQVLALEKAYCDREDSVALPRLDPASLPVGARGLLLLMTRDVWTVDYRSMAMANSNQNRLLYLRRMATEAIHGVTLLGDGYDWYFEDKNKKWIKYGETDSAGETNLVVGVTSDDLEHAYRQNPTGSLAFMNAKFKYTLDFQAMVQTNMQTQVRRPVIRRPRPHLKESKKGEEKQDDLALPKDWEPMQAGERLHMVTLSTSSPEYQQVIALINGQIATQNIVKIERVQNPFLWRALQNKIQELMTLYKQDTSKVNVRQLFHGTRADVVPAVCSENFDWRLHGSSAGQAYGRGTYFAPAASTSYGYCGAGTNGLKYMFVALVAVGSMVTGNPSMARPPQNPVTGMPHESSGNGSASNASIIVKYDKQEYYPQYVITLT